MKSFHRFIAVTSILAAAAFGFSCKSTEPAPQPAADAPQEKVLVSTQGTEWEASEFSGQNQYGYFFTTPELGQYSMVEGEFKKAGGYNQSGFGLVFGYTADQEGWLADYLRFEITTAGQFSAYACRGSTYIDLVEGHGQNTAYRYDSPAVKGGYNSVNKLKVQRTGEKDYTLYINSTKVLEFTAPEGFSNSDGVMAFFSVGKADQEQFPEEPVRVTYRLTNFTESDGTRADK